MLFCDDDIHLTVSTVQSPPTDPARLGQVTGMPVLTEPVATRKMQDPNESAWLRRAKTQYGEHDKVRLPFLLFVGCVVFQTFQKRLGLLWLTYNELAT